MATPQIFIAYTPRGAGLLCAVVYIVADPDIYGWWTGFHDAHFPSAFFKIEDFYSTADTTLFATDKSDIYGGWKFNYSSNHPELDEPIPVDEAQCHELDQLQDAFAAEWLFFSTDSDIDAEAAAYHELELPLQDANIKSRKLNKLNKDDVIWTYASKDLDMRVIDYLMAHWPLDYGRD